MKAVFLDRDGTINLDEKGYISSPTDFELLPCAIPALHVLQNAGYKIFIITNQSGIARGYYGFKELEEVHSKMLETFAEHKIKIQEILVSPYHKDGIVEPYNIEHEDRKPGLGLLRKACEKHKIIKKESFMIGDKWSDVIFGKKGGLTTFLVQTGNGNSDWDKHRDSNTIQPDFIATNILAAAEIIHKLNKKG